MTPEDRELINRLIESQKTLHEAVNVVSEALTRQIASNMVLVAAVGALYGELSKVSGESNSLDTMLERFTSVIETNPDSRGYVLSVTDNIRNFAETLGR